MIRVLLCVFALLLVALPAAADLPAITVPPTPGEPRLRTGPSSVPDNPEQERIQQLLEAQRLRMLAAEGATQPAGPPQPIDQMSFEVMMKSASDPTTPLAEDFGRQLQEMKAFGSLQLDRQNEAVPELLGLLRSKQPLPKGKLSVRDRANAALSRLAGVTFGQFSPAESSDQAAQESDKLMVEQWNAWWKEVRELEAAERSAVTAEYRLAIIEENMDDLAGPLFVQNVEFAREASDPSPLPLLAEALKAPDISRKNETQRLLQLYFQIYMATKPGAEHVRPVLEFAQAVNTPEIAQEVQWARNLGNYLGQMTGTRTNMYKTEKVKIQRNGKEVDTQVMLLSPEALAEWNDWINKETGKKQDAPPAKPDAAADDNVAPPAQVEMLQNGAVLRIQVQGGENVIQRLEVQVEKQ